jgi:hypothetical protein
VLLPDIGLHGAYLRTALVSAFGRHQLSNALRAGAVRPLWTGVVVESSRILQLRTRAAAALLAVGRHAVLCGPTAAALHGCTAISSTDVHVVVPYRCKPRSRAGLVVHHSCFYAEQVVELDGLRVLALPHVVADLLCVASPSDALAVGDEVPEEGGASIRGDASRRRAATTGPTRPARHGARGRSVGARVTTGGVGSRELGPDAVDRAGLPAARGQLPRAVPGRT